MSLNALLDADFKTAPYRHQLKEFEQSAELPARALLWSMRTGKSKQIVDTACSLHRAGRLDAVLVFAPNGVHENWVVREVPTHTWDSVDWSALAWQTRLSGRNHEGHEAWWSRLQSARSGRQLSWVTFNSESMTRADVKVAVARMLKSRRVMAVWDESSDFRTPGSKRTKMSRALARRAAYRRILDGTAITNSPLHAFAQYELLEKAALGYAKYADFENHFAEFELARGSGGRRYPKLKGYRNLEELRALMAAWSSVVLREDCDDMPDVITRVRAIEPTAEQKRIYEQLRNSFLVDLQENRVSIGERTIKLLKLQQVLSGFLIDEYKQVHTISGVNPRLEALAEEVYLAPGKVIVWCQFHEEMDRIAERLLVDGHEVIPYHGRVSNEAKRDGLALFQTDDGHKRVLVGHAKSGGRGKDMSTADTIIWYSHTFDAIQRQQASERATKVAGKNVTMIDLVAPGVDQYIRDTVERRVSVADDVAGRGLQSVLKGIAL